MSRHTSRCKWVEPILFFTLLVLSLQRSLDSLVTQPFKLFISVLFQHLYHV
jgi:hypothetical protein